MTSFWKIATPIACVAVICGAAIFWRVNKQKAIERKKLAEAVTGYKARAEKGDAEAQYGLAYMYYQGKGVAQDYGEAVRWARRAADQGYAKAQAALGIAYYDGKGVPQDYTEASRWYRKAADQGYAKAQIYLGSMYYYGKGVSQDYSEAARWYRRAADQGDAEALYDLGYMYSHGTGVPQDYAEAARWYRKAADKGDERAERALKTRLSTPSKVLITIEFLGTILLLVSSYRSAGGAFGPQQRTAIVKELLALSYLALVCMGLFHMGVAQTNAFRVTKNLLAGMVLAMLISVIWQQSAKSVLRISGMLFVAFNLYAIAHYDVKHFAPAIRMFYLTNALLIGMAIPSAAAVWLAAKTYQEGQSRSGQAAPSQT